MLLRFFCGIRYLSHMEDKPVLVVIVFVSKEVDTNKGNID